MVAAEEVPATGPTRASRDGRAWRGSGWILASAAALAAESRWLSTTSVEYLALAATATAVAAALMLALREDSRRWAAVSMGALALAIGAGAVTQHREARLASAWDAERARIASEAITSLRREVARSVRALRGAAAQALRAPAERDAAFARLGAIASREGVAVTLYRADSAFAWAGEQRVNTDSIADSVGVAGTTFYLALYAADSAGSDRAVATRLLYALPPADRIASSIGEEVATRTGVAGFHFASAGAGADGQPVMADGGTARLFVAEPVLFAQGEVQLRVLQRARVVTGLLLAIALAAFLVAAWRLKRGWRWRGALVLATLACVALAPLSAYSNYLSLFDPAVYFTPLGGPLTANAAALALTSAVFLLYLLATIRRPTRLPGRRLAAVTVILVAGLGPFLLRDLARGIQIPPYGVGASLWLTWEVPLFLAAAAVMLAGASAGSVLVGPSRGVPPTLAPGLAAAGAVLAPVLWLAPSGWPWWYTFLWIAAIAALAVSRRTGALIIAAATVAALGATTLVWGAAMRARVQLAEQDVAHLGTGDPYARDLAARLVQQLVEVPAGSRESLLQAYATSDLAAAAFPTVITVWTPADVPAATLATAPLSARADSLVALVRAARVARGPVEAAIPATPALTSAIAAPTDSGVVTVVVAPRSLLIPPEPAAQLLGLESQRPSQPAYTLQASPLTAGATVALPAARWRREDTDLHGDWIAPSGEGTARVHVEVELRSLPALVQRGTLIVLLDLAIVGLLWLTSVVADGIATRWLNVRRQRYARSYRLRLSLALFAFFIVPAIAFAVWSYQQLFTDAARARALLVGEALRSARAVPTDRWLAAESRRLTTPLLLYEHGVLSDASDTLLLEIAPTGRLLDARAAESMLVQGEASAQLEEDVAGERALFGYRAIAATPSSMAVLAAPAWADDLPLGRRARDLGVLVLFATAIGALAALWLSGAAARQLARPIGSLRQAALALAAGEREPALERDPTAEFAPVFAAFRRMVSDLNASRTALENAQRRTSAVLRNVASAVIAVGADAGVTLGNPRADELLGAPLATGTRLELVGHADLARRAREFLAGGEDDAEFEMTRGDRQWRGRFTRLLSGGAVITLDDVTDMARAERVLAWGEMARQVAHEIKNPLTPIRLGVQHLRRARSDPRVDFDVVLEQNVERILREIDHLDEIARAFSRYGQAPEQDATAQPTDVAAVLRDVVALESMGGSDEPVRWALTGADDAVPALARRDELREVLLNVLENARLAHAKRVDVSLGVVDGRVRVNVRDDGRGIPRSVLPRIFEPHFSTRTSGSGLGLAVSRRVIESWGGRMEIESEDGVGTRVEIELVAAR